MSYSKAEQTAAITESIHSGRRAALASFDSRKYSQHNLNIGDGLRPILEFMDDLPRDRSRSNVIRAIEDGDNSVVHVDYELGSWGNLIGFDVHRWEDDHIVEHRDNACSAPVSPNSSGRSMLDGPTNIEELERTEEHRRLITRFTEDVLLGGCLISDPLFFANGMLVQHSANYGDGVDAFKAEMAFWRERGSVRYEKVHKILG